LRAVQRAAIVLNEKGTPFVRIDIELATKPDWFLKISPTGRVPVLKVGEEALFESAAIVEYLDETQGPALHPSDPVAKARHRAWMEFGSGVLGLIWTLETTADRAAFEKTIAALRDRFAKVEEALSPGPFFAGEHFSIVDAVFAPVFRYFDTFDEIVELGVFADLPKVQAWRRALAGRESVRKAVVADYGDRLRNFLVKQNGVFAHLIASPAKRDEAA
jgi:glutathione S-transferase